MKALKEFRLNHLLTKLQREPASVLSLIDEDDLLNKREHTNGLVIANAGKKLFTPEAEHQLFAKGIVYTRDPYTLVSLPLIKIYNHTEHGMVDEVTYALAQEDDVYICLPFKEDGYMAQIFAHDDEVYVTTRSMLEGVPVEHTYDFDYVGTIRTLADRKYPGLLDSKLLGDLCITCEVLHPGMENGVTRYGKRQDLVVLSVFDRATHTYWNNKKLQEWCATHDFKAVDTLASDVSLEKAVGIVRDMSGDETIPEGGVVCFEKNGEVIHRVKVKTKRWCDEFALRYQCSIKSVTKMCFGNPEMEDWDYVTKYLIEQGLTAEETLDYYEEYHTRYMDWLRGCKERASERIALLETCLEAVSGVAPEEQQKALALYAQMRHPKTFALIMNLYNADYREEQALFDAMWQDELYSGIKGLIFDAKQAVLNDD